jgi:stage II sporulation protein E
VYEVIYNGFSLGSVLYGVLGVLLSGALTFLMSGIYDGGVSFADMLVGAENIFDKKRGERERIGMILFQGAFLLLCFLISLSLTAYNFFGISIAYIFSSVTTIFAARRFGVARAVAVGFVSGLAVSGSYSVSFALMGLGVGVLLPVSIAYGLAFGGLLLSAWGIYVGGAMGFLSVFPEYVTASIIMLPFLKRFKPESVEEPVTKSITAEGMVATRALAYKSSGEEGIILLEAALSALARALRAYGVSDGRVSYFEYRDLSIRCTSQFCESCSSYEICKETSPAPCIENIDIIATKLYKNERIRGAEELLPTYCRNGEELLSVISDAAAALDSERYKSRKVEEEADEYELISRLIGEVRASCEKEHSLDGELSERLSLVLSEVGFLGGVIRAFGDRKKHFIGAGPDPDGSIVTSAALRDGIERTAGVRLSTPSFYRKGEVALFECSSAPMYRVEFATATDRGSIEEVSGDTVRCFESADGRFYSLVSDGMGSGEAASRTSRFAAEFLSEILNTSPAKSTALHILNHIIRSSGSECSATVDLFEVDLYNGEALFFKCGAAASYVKRGGSIFRVRSESAPIGLMKTIDAERIRVEIKSGDLVIMISDGISQCLEDAAWLLEFLNKSDMEELSDYAEKILHAAEEHSGIKDDRSVVVARVSEIK